jgi:hypothetical protein
MAQIDKPNLHFNPRLYTATGSAQSITGVGFQPDLVWIKDRDSTGWHFWTDAVRGVTKTIFSNTNNAESTETGGLTAFGTDGYSIGTHSNINTNGNNVVSMNWKAANSSGSSNGDGTITSTVSANQTAGFSVVKWTGNGSAGATIGHGLGATPAVIIEKITSSTGDWLVYHHKNTSAPETEFLRLSTDAATQDELTIWNDQAPTSSVFYVGSESTVNGNGNNFIAYCFAEKTGYSKFGSYTGNGNVDGTFVYTGFAPAFVMTKRTDSTSDWLICDNKRPGYNVINKKLFPNRNQGDDSYDSFDFVSNGFKIRSSGTGHNASGGTFIYMAFAENPIVGSNNIPTTAR